MKKISETIKKHRSVLSPYQAEHFESIIRSGLGVYVDSITKGKPYNTFCHNLAFLVTQSDIHACDQKRVFSSCAKLPKKTINSLVKKGVLKRIEVYIDWQYHTVWIVDGFGMTTDQSGNSWLKLQGIDPNENLDEERKTRLEIIEEIRIHFQK